MFSVLLELQPCLHSTVCVFSRLCSAPTVQSWQPPTSLPCPLTPRGRDPALAVGAPSTTSRFVPSSHPESGVRWWAGKQHTISFFGFFQHWGVLTQTPFTSIKMKLYRFTFLKSILVLFFEDNFSSPFHFWNLHLCRSISVRSLVCTELILCTWFILFSSSSSSSSPPSPLSVFLALQFFVFCHSLLQLSQLLVSGYMKSSISTIERRYGLTSQKSGLLAAFNEVCSTSTYKTLHLKSPVGSRLVQ